MPRIRLLLMLVCTDPLLHNTPNSPESKLVGCFISQCPQKVAKANPVTYINGNEPPFSIHHGALDCTVPGHQSKLLHEALLLHQQQSELIIYPEGNHGNFIHADVRKKMVQLFDKVLIH